MLLLNQSAYRQWVALLLLYFVLTPSVYAIKASFIARPTSGPVPLYVALDARGSQASAGATITDYQWTSSDKQFMLPLNMQQMHYFTPGTYTLTLTVKDNLGNQDTTTQKITALSEGSGGTDPGTTPTPSTTPPVANFTISPSSGTAPLTVTLNATSSRATTSGASISDYQWQVTPPISTTPSSPYSSVTFTQAGNYTITLTVRDNLGKSAVKQGYLTVSPAVVVTPSPTSPLLASSQGASFYGGVLVDSSFLRNNSLIRSSDNVKIQASIKVASAHINKPADILVAVNYPSGSGWFLKNGKTGNNFEPWGGPDSPLPWPLVQSLVLTEIVNIDDIFSGQFGDLVGKFDIYIIYHVVDGPFVYNEGTPLQFEVVK
ncbi:MAG: PKD domain-containing protein [Candidatus Parabeggiatoa sp.]|nr:PKD domain-containing protein [Candidatus Parabeggiatoa sp.]